MYTEKHKKLEEEYKSLQKKLGQTMSQIDELKQVRY